MAIITVRDVDVEVACCDDEEEHPSTGSAHIPCSAPSSSASSRLAIQAGMSPTGSTAGREVPSEEDEARGLRDLSRLAWEALVPDEGPSADVVKA